MAFLDVAISLKASSAQRDAWEAAAEEANLPFHTWLRQMADAAAGNTQLPEQQRKAAEAHKRAVKKASK